MLIQDIDSLLKRKIIKEIYFKHPISCAELSELLDKSIPVVTRSVNDLIDEGWLEEAGYAPSKGGRRPMCYQIKATDNYIIAVSVDRFGVKTTLVDLENNFVLPPVSLPVDLKSEKNAHMILVDHINNFIKTNDIDRKKIISIGIGMPGFIDVKKGVNYSHFKNIPGSSIRDFLSEQLNLPVYIDNDSSVIALAELRFGDHTKISSDTMVINISWGIGLGMIINGQIYRGHYGFAGELSHIPLEDSDKLCECGKKGCLETEATLRVATENALLKIKENTVSTLKYYEDLNAMCDYLLEEASNGNQEAIAIFEEIGTKIGKAIAILIHITNPETIILAGRGAKVGRILLAKIQQSLNQYCIPRLYKHTKLRESNLGSLSGLIGAAALAMENID